MSFLSFLLGEKKKTASVAKERLQIILAHERSGRSAAEPDYLPDLQRELVAVIGKYVRIRVHDPCQIMVVTATGGLVPSATGSARVLSPIEARSHHNTRCTVAMTVQVGKDDQENWYYYLNSESDFRDPRNISVLISYRDAVAFRQAGIRDPAAYYIGRTIRVTGKVYQDATGRFVRIPTARDLSALTGEAAPAPGTTTSAASSSPTTRGSSSSPACRSGRRGTPAPWRPRR